MSLMAEYCDTLQSKEKRNREHKACLNERAILRLLDHCVTRKSGRFLAHERGDFVKTLNRSCGLPTVTHHYNKIAHWDHSSSHVWE